MTARTTEKPCRSNLAGAELGARSNGAAPDATVPSPAHMSLAERSDIVLGAARVLYLNGQTTHQTLAAADRLAGTLGLRTTLIPRWGELQLQAQDERGARLTSIVPADPSGVHMGRVAALGRTIADLTVSGPPPARARAAITGISEAPPLPTWLFALAAATGALSLAIIFGLRHVDAGTLIFLSAGIGGVVRRRLAKFGANLYLQPLAAALIAGVIGALAVQWNISSPLRLVALCPCLVLVPGPHLLNGALDVLEGRVALGLSRLLYAAVVLIAIATGLLVGLAMLGESLTVTPPGRSVPLLRDMIFAGVAAACYGVYFNMPLRMLAWPVAAAAPAHAIRWLATSEFHSTPAIAALAGCAFVGLVMAPVAGRRHLPFAAIGFASVVSMMPGSYVMRMAGGVVEIADGSHTTLALISGTIANGATAFLIILAMGIGLLVPKLVTDRVTTRPRGHRAKPVEPCSARRSRREQAAIS